MTIPTHPVVFTKPADALAGPFDEISIHKEVQKQLDYEGELVVVVGRDGKNIAPDNALDYVLGYTCGNDLSARDYQVPNSVGGGQYSYAKSFDGFAPIGPCITERKEHHHATFLNISARTTNTQSTPRGKCPWT